MFYLHLIRESFFFPLGQRHLVFPYYLFSFSSIVVKFQGTHGHSILSSNPLKLDVSMRLSSGCWVVIWSMCNCHVFVLLLPLKLSGKSWGWIGRHTCFFHFFLPTAWDVSWRQLEQPSGPEDGSHVLKGARQWLSVSHYWPWVTTPALDHLCRVLCKTQNSVLLKLLLF